jgi:hypothetical protein
MCGLFHNLAQMVKMILYQFSKVLRHIIPKGSGDRDSASAGLRESWNTKIKPGI